MYPQSTILRMLLVFLVVQVGVSTFHLNPQSEADTSRVQGGNVEPLQRAGIDAPKKRIIGHRSFNIFHLVILSCVNHGASPC